jgi:hypothetical protein
MKEKGCRSCCTAVSEPDWLSREQLQSKSAPPTQQQKKREKRKEKRERKETKPNSNARSHQQLTCGHQVAG